MVTLRDIAIQLCAEQETQNNTSDKALFVLGQSDSGKSTLIARWLGKTVNIKKAPGLDYFWLRKSNDICNIWELPKTISPTIISSILKPERKYSPVVFIVVIDLSKPNAMIQTVPEVFKYLGNFTFTKLVIFANKYDIFQNLESEHKKNVCKFLRAVALINNAYLVFYSSEIPALVKRAGDVLDSVVWNSSLKAHTSLDYHTPLFVTPGNDNWDDLGMTKTSLDHLCIVYNKIIQS